MVKQGPTRDLPRHLQLHGRPARRAAGSPLTPNLGSGHAWQRLRLDAPRAREREIGPRCSGSPPSEVTDSTAFGHAGAVFVLCSQHTTHPHEPVVSVMPHLIVGIAIVKKRKEKK
eukprot:scaffold107564_cov34-Phaeocystis_antarctica.AAC.1